MYKSVMQTVAFIAMLLDFLKALKALKPKL